MTDYLPLLGIALFLLAVLAVLAWPWLRIPATREKAVVSVLVALFLSLALYLHVGSPFLQPELENQKQKHAQVTDAVEKLQARLRQDGDDVALWAQLGAAYIEMEHYPQAVAALKKAVQLSEGQPQLVLMYGKAQMLAADGKITAEAKQAFELAALLMPDNPDPLFLLALERMQAGDRSGARERLQALLPLLPEGIPLRGRIEQMLKE